MQRLVNYIRGLVTKVVVEEEVNLNRFLLQIVIDTDDGAEFIYDGSNRGTNIEIDLKFESLEDIHSFLRDDLIVPANSRLEASNFVREWLDYVAFGILYEGDTTFATYGPQEMYINVFDLKDNESHIIV